jgi:hypothetical protein
LGQYNFYINEILGDTTIGSIGYKKMFRSNNWSTSPYTSSTPHYSNSLPVFYVGAWRQDIPNKKVYYVNATQTTEELMFDFDLAVGDTVIANLYDTICVGSLDSALVGNVYHRAFRLTNRSCQTDFICPALLIEGVGYSEGLRQIYTDNYSGWGQQLLCFSYQSMSLYPSPGFPCALTVGISDILDGKITFSVMPNPVSDVVSLNVNCMDEYFIEVQNDLGQSVFSQKRSALLNSSIDLSDQTNGIYFISITDSKGNSATKKILKQ